MNTAQLLYNFGRVFTKSSQEGKFDILNAVNSNQIQSKTWIFDELVKVTKNVRYEKIAVIGGWYGLLMLPLIAEKLFTKQVDFYEKDNACITKSRDFFGGVLPFDCNYISMDIEDNISLFVNNQYDLVINPSCEHMIDMKYFNSARQTIWVVLATNTDHTVDNGHINPCFSEEQLVERTNFKDVLFCGTKVLGGEKKRFMAIGTR